MLHPWNDPWATPPLRMDRPDWALPFAPDPRDFPFTEWGQRDYYQAAISAADTALHAARMRAARIESDRSTAAAQFLLLLS